MREATSGTEIAALEASRNADQVLAEGSLVGERRAAWARIAQVAMFGIITNASGGSSRTMFFVGFGYSIYTLLMLVGVYRFATPTIRSARWIPFAIATIDFAFVSVQGVLGNEFRGFGNLGVIAIGTVIPLSFAVARTPTYHVVYAIALAEASFLVVAGDMGAMSDQIASVVFICGGLLVLGLMVAMTNVAVKNMFSGLRKRDNLTRFLPRQVVERVIAMGPEALAPVEREVTVMFSDIRGFTGMSEGLEPREVLMMLDDYFGRMSQIVKGHDGVVGKFLGDGMLALLGRSRSARRSRGTSGAAARDMRRVLRELNEHRAQVGRTADPDRHRDSHRPGGGGHARRCVAGGVHDHRRRSERGVAHRGPHQGSPGRRARQRDDVGTATGHAPRRQARDGRDPRSQGIGHRLHARSVGAERRDLSRVSELAPQLAARRALGLAEHQR